MRDKRFERDNVQGHEARLGSHGSGRGQGVGLERAAATTGIAQPGAGFGTSLPHRLDAPADERMRQIGLILRDRPGRN